MTEEPENLPPEPEFHRRPGLWVAAITAAVLLILLGLYWGGRFLLGPQEEAPPDAAVILAECPNIYTDLRAALIDALRDKKDVCGVDVSNQNQAFLVQGLTAIQGLRVIKAGHNRMRKLPDWIGELTALELLDVSHNYIEAVPDAIGSLQQLKILDLRGNPLPEREADKAKRLLPHTQVLI